jgi:hypothetical protein
MVDQDSNPNKKVEYVAPSQEVLRKFANDVCDRMNELYPSEFSSTEVKQGFFQFVNVVVNIQLKQANRQNE